MVQQNNSDFRITSFSQLPLIFPAYLVMELNGGYKLKDPVKYFSIFKRRVEARCPFAGGYADMSAQETLSGAIKTKANLRLEDGTLTIRVDNSIGKFHIDIENNQTKIERHKPVSLDPGIPPLLAAFEVAKNELLYRARNKVPSFGSIDRPKLELLEMMWATKIYFNSFEVELLLPPYPGSRLSGRIFTHASLPFRFEPIGIDIKGIPFNWEHHSLPPSMV
jgi:hypothetical protein